MRFLLKIFFCLALLLFFAAPTLAAGACLAPQPTDPQVTKWIQEAQKLGGAAANVPAPVLKAIYFIEATTAYADPDSYSCRPVTPNSSALGLMQVLDGTYEQVVPKQERMNDAGACSEDSCQLSRCNPVDAMEIAARVLLDKVRLWDANKAKATGKITTKEQVYNASCNYYDGTFQPNDLTNALSPVGINPHDGQQSYCEFVGVYSGYYSTGNLPWPRGAQAAAGGGTAVWKYEACTQTPQADFDFHPLRPNPGEPTGVPDDSFLTTYCAMRATAVEQNRFDKRDEFIDPQTVGTMTQDFSKFITPLLSITDPTKSDYSLPFTDKAQRYLADYLEGRAYYEPQAEPANPTPTQQADLFNRLGVIRKLLPMSQQDKLKRALIQRGAGIFDPGPTASSSAYGFTPASVKVHDYVVGYWGKGSKAVTLSDFVDHWAPLPEDYPNGGYSEAYAAWQIADGGKWYSLWPYVPMFSREDSPGKIEIFDSNPPPAPLCPGCSFAEENTKSDKKTVEVSHPHLARTYEVSTTLSYLLTPQAVHDSSIPVETWGGNPQNPPQTILHDEWTPKMWDMSDWWLDPDAAHFKPHPTPLNSKTFTNVILGPLCDLDPKYNEVVYSSGDPAYDNSITTSVKRIDHDMPQPPDLYSPPIPPVACGTDYLTHTCEKCVNDQKNVSDCFYYKEVRSNPTYFQTQTPFLVQILNSTMLSGRGIFDLFKPFSAVKKDYEENDWPGLGNEGEESPVYDYTANSGEQAHAEAGTMKPGDSQGYYYRFLGDIQCAKERTMQVLQPFITGEAYKPFASNCFKPKGEPGPAEQIQPTGAACTTEKMPLEFPNDSNSPIAQRAWAIVSDLYQGFWCYWNRSPGDFASDVTDYPPSYPELFDEDLYALIPNPTPEQLSQQYFNMFWCTWLVTKAFNETGHSMPTDLLYTPDMVAWFQSQGKYLEAGSVTYEDVAPGDAVFFRIPPDYYRLNHVAIVYSVSEDGLTTVESNAGYKTMFYPTDGNGHFQTVGDIKIEGFGKP